MHQRPEDLLESVTDEMSFLGFLKALSDDWETERAMEEKNPSPPYGPGALGWQNGTIGQFLESASACGIDNQNKGGISPGSNPWRCAAEILLAGKYYE